nr:hypothetical protein Iba_chr12cCG2350 [Ipomoea batatas]
MKRAIEAKIICWAYSDYLSRRVIPQLTTNLHYCSEDCRNISRNLHHTIRLMGRCTKWQLVLSENRNSSPGRNPQILNILARHPNQTTCLRTSNQKPY